MTNLRLKDIKLFSSEEEKKAAEARQIQHDADFVDPHKELATMHDATKWGIYFFSAVTLLSTAALLYRVTFPHMAELVGTSAATISMLVLSFGVALAIEIMLRGNWEPFCKKLFVKGELDLVLGSLGVVFTGIILYGAITGMEIISDAGKTDPQLESVTASAASTNSTIEANKNEIALLMAGKGKGVYAWQGKPTPHAKKRVAELEAQNTAALNALTALSSTTEKMNAAKIETFSDKQAKAVHYLSLLAIGAEILKLIVFVFWGYRSMQLNAFTPKPSTPANPTTPLPQPEKPKNNIDPDIEAVQRIRKTFPVPISTPQSSGAKTDNAAVDAYKKGLNHRAVLTTRFKDYRVAKKDTTNLEEQWEINEDRIWEACKELGLEYPEPKYTPEGDLVQNDLKLQ